MAVIPDETQRRSGIRYFEDLKFASNKELGPKDYFEIAYRGIDSLRGDKSMEDQLDGKKILVVDDEVDILETMEELLHMCQVETASSFEEAWNKLGTSYYDFAILDIMGVDGYRLLELANERKIPAIMLTAHAMTPDNVMKSIKRGATYFLPKEEMANIVSHMHDIMDAMEKGQSTWKHWLDRLGVFFDGRFGPDWKADDKEFWIKYLYY
jgi:CheY-like chemotaxis protein